MMSLSRIFKLLTSGLLAMSTAIIMNSCGDSESFNIEGHIADKATMNIRYIYYAGGSLNRGITAARDGKFEFKGVSSTPTIVDITDNDYRVLARVYVTNGERITINLDRNDPSALKISGDEVSERWAKMLSEHAEQLKSPAANDVIEEYVAENPTDIVSTLLMTTAYDASVNPARADSIMSSIDQSVRPASLVDSFNATLLRLVTDATDAPIDSLEFFTAKDSLAVIKTADKHLTLIALTNANVGRQDSIVKKLRHLGRKAARKHLQIADLSTDRDSITWHRDIRTDSATWRQGWLPGALASSGIERLGVPSLPYFVATDSTGTQLLRTSSISVMEAYLDSCLTNTYNIKK